MQEISKNRCFAGTQGVYQHQSQQTGTPMTFSVFVPHQEQQTPQAILWYLSGLTCTHENFTTKAGAQRYASEANIVIIAPDTSPRGANIPGEDESYDFGSGAGFYLDATRDPWNQNYNMYSYITKELPELIVNNFNVDMQKQGITGHSMGGHGALTIALKNPSIYKSVSAFAPICAPSQCPWGKKALSGYLGDDKSTWAEHDSVALINNGHRFNQKILVDQGLADNFLEDELKPDLLKQACQENDLSLELRQHEGYDHSYYFISSFIGDHIRFHEKLLNSTD